MPLSVHLCWFLCHHLDELGRLVKEHASRTALKQHRETVRHCLILFPHYLDTLLRKAFCYHCILVCKHFLSTTDENRRCPLPVHGGEWRNYRGHQGAMIAVHIR